MQSRSRNLPIIAALIVGIGMIVAPFVFQMFDRAPLGGDMIEDFEPYMTVEAGRTLPRVPGRDRRRQHRVDRVAA